MPLASSQPAHLAAGAARRSPASCVRVLLSALGPIRAALFRLKDLCLFNHSLGPINSSGAISGSSFSSLRRSCLALVRCVCVCARASLCLRFWLYLYLRTLASARSLKWSATRTTTATAARQLLADNKWLNLSNRIVDLTDWAIGASEWSAQTDEADEADEQASERLPVRHALITMDTCAMSARAFGCEWVGINNQTNKFKAAE